MLNGVPNFLHTETYDINDLLKHINADNAKDFLLFVDLDNTLIRAAQFIGTDDFFDMHYDLQINNGKDEKNAFEETLELHNAVNMISSANAVEGKKTQDVINTLLGMGVTVIGFTLRGANIADATQKQLTAAGLDKMTEPFKNIRFSLKIAPHASFEDGILYCDDKPKGECLDEFMQHATVQALKLNQKKIIGFIDDKKKNIDKVAAVINTTKPHFAAVEQYVGLHYRYLESTIAEAKLDNKIAIGKVQKQHFQARSILLSDEQAQHIVHQEAQDQQFTLLPPAVTNAFDLAKNQVKIEGHCVPEVPAMESGIPYHPSREYLTP